ncbi:MAG: TetR/AcrR family transcriptional regulator [Acidimicrobiia bacterium]
MRDELLSPPEGGKARRTYEALVEGARTEINLSGVLRPESVAERAGVSTATFYTYFPSKDDLVAAAFDRVLQDLEDRIASSLTIEGVLDAGLHETMSRVVAGAIEGFGEDALMFRLALARLPEHRTIRDVYRGREEAALRIIRRFVELGMAAKRIPEGDAAAMAGALLVILQGCNNHILLDGRTLDAVPYLVDAAVATLGGTI